MTPFGRTLRPRACLRFETRNARLNNLLPDDLCRASNPNSRRPNPKVLPAPNLGLPSFRRPQGRSIGRGRQAQRPPNGARCSVQRALQRIAGQQEANLWLKTSIRANTDHATCASQMRVQQVTPMNSRCNPAASTSPRTTPSFKSTQRTTIMFRIVLCAAGVAPSGPPTRSDMRDGDTCADSACACPRVI